ncbi:MAG: hypothetical protein CLLPBCKN_006977 [Chroococcidiopsis cubana SAG 39.79]|nr:hypothetical protein [Chroococcidiopsis cubana SAG 39.79]
MKAISLDLELIELFIADFNTNRILTFIYWAMTLSPVVVVLVIKLTTTARLINGRLRQLRVI